MDTAACTLNTTGLHMTICERTGVDGNVSGIGTTVSAGTEAAAATISRAGTIIESMVTNIGRIMVSMVAG
jgi:hypothetical protein